ncbi:MAG: hypothetical protein FGM61_03860, partial [Sediminibacterium sp.]|nr:hypothetical protein [Sediminibacterium sp.]
MKKLLLATLLVLMLFPACKKPVNPPSIVTNDSAYRIAKTIVGDSLSVDVVVDKPQGISFDVLMVFHGTV